MGYNANGGIYDQAIQEETGNGVYTPNEQGAFANQSNNAIFEKQTPGGEFEDPNTAQMSNQASRAEIAARAAKESEIAAELAETNATAQTGIATNAAATATTKASEASASATSAASSASLASTSATTATTQANNASASATIGQTSATNAATSATTATTGATNASNSASAASTSATNASNSASAASTSATNAASSATSALGSATSATASASSASTSETNAASSATSAGTSASTATTQAGIATTQAGIATTKASETSTSASNAATSASSASTSATNAATAQTAAESARDATLAAYDSFDDRYLGSKSSAPTLDNDGNALIGGALYFDSVSQSMKLYTGSVWVDAYVPGNSFLVKANNLSDLISASTARTNLGLGTAATTNSTDYATAAQGTTADTAYADRLKWDGGSTDLVASTGRTSLGVTATGSDTTYAYRANNLSDLVSASTARTNLGLGTAATTDSTAYATAAQGAKADTALQPSAIGVTVQAYDTDLAAFALKTAPTGAVVGTTDTQTLTNKVIDSITNSIGADHLHFKIKATEAITKGNVLKVTGYNAGEDAIEVAKVSSSADIAVGIAHENLTSGSFGALINTGLLEGVDTSAFSVGNVLYPNTSGGLTTTKPSSGTYQAIAYVLRSHSVNGTILIEATEPNTVLGALATLNTVGTTQIDNNAVTVDKLAATLDLGSIV